MNRQRYPDEDIALLLRSVSDEPAEVPVIEWVSVEAKVIVDVPPLRDTESSE